METTQAEVSAFLDSLRESGEVNMWSSITYVRQAFPSLPSKVATKMTTNWMRDFGK